MENRDLREVINGGWVNDNSNNRIEIILLEPSLIKIGNIKCHIQRMGKSSIKFHNGVIRIIAKYIILTAGDRELKLIRPN